MISKIENLLMVAEEECAEVAQACSKIMRFGLDSYHPDKGEDELHVDEVMIEYYQLQSIIEELQKNKVLPVYDEERIKAIKEDKLTKVEKYYELYTKNLKNER